MPLPEDIHTYLDPPLADASPAAAYAAHKARADGIASFFAASMESRRLNFAGAVADENNTVALLAHLHAATVDPEFAYPGDEPSRTLAPKVLKSLEVGDGLGTFGKYDFALKGLVTIVYRYESLLSDAYDHVLGVLVPGEIRGGGHDVALEGFTLLGVGVIPETENHLLMIETSRYLFNQLYYKRSPEARFDNVANGLGDWLLGFLQQSARHDFMEFSARPYARLTLHTLLNLYEFAHEPRIRTAAQILLDYTMVKAALSASRQRRVAPFRRHQEQINHHNNPRNHLLDGSGDQVSHYLLAYTGATAVDGRTTARFPDSAVDCGVLAATSTYRPPPAAYTLGVDVAAPTFHRFHHGARPRLTPVCTENAEPGIEIYYKSPSFLLSAGGVFLNSGYGRDELEIATKHRWEQTVRAQATTLVPTREDVGFADLVRFEPWPDPPVDPYVTAIGPDDQPLRYHTLATSLGVGPGIACGPNLRPAEKRIVWENSSQSPPSLAVGPVPGLGGSRRVFMTWRGFGNNRLNVAAFHRSTAFGIDGAERLEDKVTLGELSDAAPALESFSGRLYLAWKGYQNKQLNVAYSDDNGRTFVGKKVLAEQSDHGPSIAAHQGRLYLAWTGVGNHILNIGRLDTSEDDATAGTLLTVSQLGETTDATPAMASLDGRLVVAWKGNGNENLNVGFSEDAGATLAGKRILSELSGTAPGLAAHRGGLYLTWSGLQNSMVNVARIRVLATNPGPQFILGDVTDKVTLGETTMARPALVSLTESVLGLGDDTLVLGWTGTNQGSQLNVQLSRDGSFRRQGPWLFDDRSAHGYYVGAYRTLTTAHTVDEDDLPPLDNLAVVIAAESSSLSFDEFRTRLVERNPDLPALLRYGQTYVVTTADGARWACWFDSTAGKYSARVVDADDPAAVRDLSTLPLAQGEHLNAGHDGLITIAESATDPAPIVLDFRNPLNPTRTDDRAARPQQWVAFGRALLDAALTYDATGRTRDADTAVRDAVQLHDELLGEASGPVVHAGIRSAAGTLRSIAQLRLDAHEPARAAGPSDEAITFLRKLTALDAPQHESLLAEGLAQRAEIAFDAERPASEVAAPGDEAAQLHGTHAARFPAGSADRLQALDRSAATYSRLGRLLDLRGDSGGAIDREHRAIAVYDQIVDADPLAYEIPLAQAWGYLMEVLHNAQRPVAELTEAGDRAARLYATHAARLPAGSPEQLLASDNSAATCSRLGRLLENRGDHDAAIERQRRAITAYGPLVASDPSTYEISLAQANGYLMEAVFGAQRPPAELTDAGDRAAEIYATHAARFPTGSADQLQALDRSAATYSRLGRLLDLRGDPDDAIDRAHRAVAAYEQIVGFDPSAYEVPLAQTWGYLTEFLFTAQRPVAELAAAGDRAAELYATHAARFPTGSADQLEALGNSAAGHLRLGRLLGERGELGAAIDRDQRAVAAYGSLVELDPSHGPELEQAVQQLAAHQAG